MNFMEIYFDATSLIFLVVSHETAKNIVISPDFLVWKFCGNAQFPHSFGQIASNYAETDIFRKISTPGNQVKLRYFWQCESYI